MSRGIRLKELVDHLFELVQNSIKANALEVYIGVYEERIYDRFRIVVEDNGKGMKEEYITRLSDPFFTKRGISRRKVGMGLALLFQDCEQAGGEVRIRSKPGVGTKVEAIFEYDNIDRPPLGDLKDLFVTILSLEDRHIRWTIEHRIDRRGYKRDLARIKKDTGRESFSTKYAREDLERYLNRLESKFDDMD